MRCFASRRAGCTSRLRPLLFIVLSLALSLPLSGCEDPDSACPPLLGGGRYCLQSSSVLPPFDAQQQLDVRVGTHREMLIAEVEVDAQGARVVALTPFGRTLLQASFDNQRASATRLPDDRLNPALVIALLQVALWPTDVVRDGLESPATLDARAGERRIVQDGETTLKIEYDGERPPFRRLRISIPAADIEIEIETLPEMKDQEESMRAPLA